MNTSEPRGSKDGPKIQQCSKVRNIMTVGATEDKKWLTVNDGKAEKGSKLEYTL